MTKRHALSQAKGSRKNKFTFWRERRAGRCKARDAAMWDIVEAPKLNIFYVTLSHVHQT